MRLVYVELPTDRIFNRLGPNNVVAWRYLNKRRDTWWEEETIAVREQVAQIWIKEYDKVKDHFGKLEKSISEVGILSPVSIIGGPRRNPHLTKVSTEPTNFIPPQYQNDLDNLLYTAPFGGSRIYVAEKLGIETIPCAVHDFSNIFPDAPEINKDNVHNWFGKEYVFTNGLPHLRCIDMNESCRDAQQAANENTKRILEQQDD
ncbi:MAG: hypothetical protein ACQ9ET_00505 [Nitrosomonadaceae bacterium]